MPVAMDPTDGTPPVTFTDPRSESSGFSARWEGDFMLMVTHPDGRIDTVNLSTATLDDAVAAAAEVLSDPPASP